MNSLEVCVHTKPTNLVLDTKIQSCNKLLEILRGSKQLYEADMYVKILNLLF